MKILRYYQFLNEKKSKDEDSTTPEVTPSDTESAESKLAKKSATIDADAEKTKSDKASKDTEEKLPGSTSGASSGDSDVRSPTSTEVRSPTSTRTEVRSPTSTETSTDAYTSGNITVTGGAGDGANTTVHIHAAPKEDTRLASGGGRKKHMPSAIAMDGPNDKRSSLTSGKD